MIRLSNLHLDANNILHVTIQNDSGSKRYHSKGPVKYSVYEYFNRKIEAVYNSKRRSDKPFADILSEMELVLDKLDSTPIKEFKSYLKSK